MQNTPATRVSRLTAAEIGAFLRRAREAAEIESQDLASLLGASQGTVTNYEHGHVGKCVQPVHLMRSLVASGPESQAAILDLLGVRLTEGTETDPELAFLFDALRMAKRTDPDWSDLAQMIRAFTRRTPASEASGDREAASA